MLVWQLLKFHETYNIYYSNKLLQVEGYVKEFHEMPSSGHDTERFKIGNVDFEFSDYIISNFGYNNAKSKGGAVDRNVYLRIKYYKNKDSNVILKLENRK